MPKSRQAALTREGTLNRLPILQSACDASARLALTTMVRFFAVIVLLIGLADLAIAAPAPPAPPASAEVNGGPPTGAADAAGATGAGGLRDAIVGFLIDVGVTFAFSLGLLLIVGLGLAALTGMLGRRRRRQHLGREISQAPTLDLVMALITLVPPMLGLVIVGWHGLLAAVLGQIAAAEVWMRLEATVVRRAAKRPRPSRFAEARIGSRFRSRAGQWIVVLVLLPVLWLLRFGQLVVWPGLERMLRQQVAIDPHRWMRITRRQMTGVVGRDRLWCWFSEWALGIFATTLDMLGALEALWMPVRFRSNTKNRRLAAALPGLMYTWLRPGDLASEPAEVTERLQACHDAMSKPAWMSAPTPDHDESADEARAAAGARGDEERGESDLNESATPRSQAIDAARTRSAAANDGDGDDDDDAGPRTSFSIEEGRPELVSDPETGPVNIRFGEDRNQDASEPMTPPSDADGSRPITDDAGGDTEKREAPDASKAPPGSS